MMHPSHAVRSLFVDTTDYSNTDNHDVGTHGMKPPSLSPLCGWRKSGTPSPISKASAMQTVESLTPTKLQRTCPAHHASPLRGAALFPQSSPKLPRTLEPLCWSAENSPAKFKSPSMRSDGPSSGRGGVSYREDIAETIYFRVPNIKLGDLYDWDEKLSAHGGSTQTEVVPPSCHKGVKINLNEEDVALFRRGQIVHAINSTCPHQGGPLELGDIEELVSPPVSGCPGSPPIGVRCPWHGWIFDLATGATVHPPGHTDRSASVYKASVEPDGSLIVGFSVLNSAYFNDIKE